MAVVSMDWWRDGGRMARAALLRTRTFIVDVMLGARRRRLLDAGWHCDEKALRAALREGANPNARGRRGMSPMHEAAERSIRCLRALIEAGADLDIRMGIGGMTPLMRAAMFGRVDAIHMLCEAGADKNATDWDGCTAAIYAAMSRRWDALRLLCEKNCDMFAFIAGEGLIDAYPEAREWVREAFERGLEKGVYRGLGKKKLSSALEWLIDRPRCVELLLDMGAEVDRKAASGSTPLMSAAEEGAHESMSILLARGARVDAPGWRGRVALWMAVAYGNLECVRVLISAGADVNGMDMYGETALENAVDAWDLEIALELVRSGADIRQEIRGEALLDNARKRCGEDFAEMLASESERRELAKESAEASAEARGVRARGRL